MRIENRERRSGYSQFSNLNFRFRSLVLLAALVLSLLPYGCTGRGQVQLVPVHRADLPSREPLTQQIQVGEAYYAVAEDGTLSIALRRNWQHPLAPRLASEWAMSLVLEGLPAGTQRLYPLGPREVRAVQSTGGDHRRWRALMGVAVVKAPRGERLRGRFHATVQQQQYGLLTGWTPAVARGPLMVLLGEFEAVPHAARVDEIVALTEADGFERPPPSAAARPEPLEVRPLPGPHPKPDTSR